MRLTVCYGCIALCTRNKIKNHGEFVLNENVLQWHVTLLKLLLAIHGLSELIVFLVFFFYLGKYKTALLEPQFCSLVT